MNDNTEAELSRRGLFGIMSASAVAAMIPSELQAAPETRKEWLAYIDAVPGACNADYLERAIKILPVGTMLVLRGIFDIHRTLILEDVGDFSIAGEGEVLIRHVGPPTSSHVVAMTGVKSLNWGDIGIVGAGHDVGLMISKYEPIMPNEFIYENARVYGGGYA